MQILRLGQEERISVILVRNFTYSLSYSLF